ncbi:hypothetical protein SAMN03159338_1479 [Sphingomonas sp. NFR04]|uniref:hypothetical protein n=1 Tax=Sphingomonas sp. NFR04 TaxID=1566283 RepID=UPI0008ED8E0F|nr:hypothetical protein [Sphingomonas sp. NFR04]SFJ47062.1 hypothetical protein SAMN03159338_1479 [Sphingomonas sp. NFR04]
MDKQQIADMLEKIDANLKFMFGEAARLAGSPKEGLGRYEMWDDKTGEKMPDLVELAAAVRNLP